MHLHHWFAFTLALTPSLASAALFPKDTLVKQIDAKGFKQAMKENVCLPILSFRSLGASDVDHLHALVSHLNEHS